MEVFIVEQNYIQFVDDNQSKDYIFLEKFKTVSKRTGIFKVVKVINNVQLFQTNA